MAKLGRPLLHTKRANCINEASFVAGCEEFANLSKKFPAPLVRLDVYRPPAAAFFLRHHLLDFGLQIIRHSSRLCARVVANRQFHIDLFVSNRGHRGNIAAMAGICNLPTNVLGVVGFSRWVVPGDGEHQRQSFLQDIRKARKHADTRRASGAAPVNP